MKYCKPIMRERSMTFRWYEKQRGEKLLKHINVCYKCYLMYHFPKTGFGPKILKKIFFSGSLNGFVHK